MSGPSETKSRTQTIHRLMRLAPNFDTASFLEPTVPEAAFIPQQVEEHDARAQN